MLFSKTDFMESHGDKKVKEVLELDTTEEAVDIYDVECVRPAKRNGTVQLQTRWRRERIYVSSRR